MLSCFNSPMKITQEFGEDFVINGKLYYKQFNLLGHNGIDIVPTGKDKSLFNIYPGKIIKIEDNPAYGLRIVIWNLVSLIYEYHCHMEMFSKDLRIGQYVGKETYLGQMGNTGLSIGAHNHLAYRETTEDGYVLNLDNGFNGYVNPRKYIDI